jgi:hypothetical protein
MEHGEVRFSASDAGILVLALGLSAVIGYQPQRNFLVPPRPPVLRQIEPAIVVTARALSLSGPLILLSQFFLRGRKRPLVLGEWLWIAQPSAWAFVFVFAILFPPMVMLLFLGLIFLHAAVGIFALPALWIELRKHSAERLWSAWAGSFISIYVSAALLQYLYLHPPVI